MFLLFNQVIQLKREAYGNFSTLFFVSKGNYFENLEKLQEDIKTDRENQKKEETDIAVGLA